jgi:hypothetical protein
MAADNLAMCVVLGALMACPLKLIRRLIAPEAAAPAARPSSADGSPPGSPAVKLPPALGGDPGSGMVITDVQAALQRQVTVPARMSGKPIARDGGLLLTEEPEAAAVWAAYQRSRERAVYGGSPQPGSPGSNGTPTGAPAAADGAGSNGVDGAHHTLPLSPPAILPPDFVASSGSGSDSPGGVLSAVQQGPRARDGSPLLTAEPSPLSLQAAYARSRDASRDSADGGGSSGDEAEGENNGQRARGLTARSAALSVVAACGVCIAARTIVVALGMPQLFLLAVSVLALSASAAGGLRGAALFAGASKLGSPLMGLFFTTVGATSAAAGVPLGSIASLFVFVLIMVVFHWAVLLAAARALALEPSILLVASNTLVGGPATAAGMATSRGWGRLVQPAMLAGSLSYGLGSPAGLALGLILGRIYG